MTPKVLSTPVFCIMFYYDPKAGRKNLVILFLKDEPRSCGYEEHHRAWSLPSGPGRGGLSNREHRLGMQMTRQARVAQQTSSLTVSRFILTHFLCERRHQASQQHGASALPPRPKPFHTEDHRSFRPYPGIGPGGVSVRSSLD